MVVLMEEAGYVGLADHELAVLIGRRRPKKVSAPAPGACRLGKRVPPQLRQHCAGNGTSAPSVTRSGQAARRRQQLPCKRQSLPGASHLAGDHPTAQLSAPWSRHPPPFRV